MYFGIRFIPVRPSMTLPDKSYVSAEKYLIRIHFRRFPSWKVFRSRTPPRFKAAQSIYKAKRAVQNPKYLEMSHHIRQRRMVRRTRVSCLR